MAFLLCQWNLVLLIALTSLLNRASSVCTRQEKADYVRRSLEPECRAGMLTALLKKDASLDEVDFDLACTAACMGRYVDWLLTECNDTNSATLAVTACLKSTNLRTREVTRCRYFFPDVAYQLVFADTSQCAALFPSDNTRCGLACSEHLNTLIDTLGCCFQAIYNSSNVIASLSQEGFLAQTQQSVLSLFRMSELLDACRDGMVPDACSGEPFAEITGTSSRMDPSPSTVDTDVVSSAPAMNFGLLTAAFALCLSVLCNN